jgi:putative NIF3 family GTP cyclohydrolase 1 type 2
LDEKEFLLRLKQVFDLKVVRHTRYLDRKITSVAVCGGAGSFLIDDAIRSGAQVFVTGDVKYHQFFDAYGQILLADIGHFESEQFTTELIFDILRKNFPNFALQISKTATNPVNYL